MVRVVVPEAVIEGELKLAVVLPGRPGTFRKLTIPLKPLNGLTEKTYVVLPPASRVCGGVAEDKMKSPEQSEMITFVVAWNPSTTASACPVPGVIPVKVAVAVPLGCIVVCALESVPLTTF